MDFGTADVGLGDFRDQSAGDRIGNIVLEEFDLTALGKKCDRTFHDDWSSKRLIRLGRENEYLNRGDRGNRIQKNDSENSFHRCVNPRTSLGHGQEPTVRTRLVQLSNTRCGGAPNLVFLRTTHIGSTNRFVRLTPWSLNCSACLASGTLITTIIHQDGELADIPDAGLFTE
jgi:hypothetical protein